MTIILTNNDYSYLNYKYIREIPANINEIPENPTGIPRSFTASIFAHQISPKTRIFLRDIPVEGNERGYSDLIKIEAFNACSCAVLHGKYKISTKKIITGEMCYDKNGKLIANIYSPFYEFGVVEFVWEYPKLKQALEKLNEEDVFATCGRTETNEVLIATYSPDNEKKERLKSLLRDFFGENCSFISDAEMHAAGSRLRRVHI